MKLKRIKRLPNLYCLLWTPTGTSHALHVRKMYVGKLLLTNKINVPHIKVKLFFFLKKKKLPIPCYVVVPRNFVNQSGFFSLIVSFYVHIINYIHHLVNLNW